MFFDEKATHYGTKNDTDHPRLVLFVQLVDHKVVKEKMAKKDEADSYQYYEWQYVSHRCLTSDA